ncbi:MAG TPA: cache domain-containing protein [Anaerolineaceae bacterium]|nr:cache domain-containing protein [Anaerolineaceae bacterium]
MSLTTASNSTFNAGRSKRTLSFRARLILASTVIIFLAVAGMGFYVFYRAQQTDLYLTQQLDATVRQQAETELQKSIGAETETLNNFFAALRKEITTLGDTTVNLLDNEAKLNTGDYWNAEEAMYRLSSTNWDNSNSEELAIFIPGILDLTPELISELNTLVQLNFTTPAILAANPDAVAIYFGGVNSQTMYYPNVDLAALVPPDFDITQRPWFMAAAPAQNPTKSAAWSDPYLDAATNGLIITVSYPVYDSSGRFRGVQGMDVQLNQITSVVGNLKIGETGHAFLLDKNKRLIAMPPAAYIDFGITPDDYPLGNVLDQAVLTKLSPDFSAAIDRMTAGESSLETVSINGIEHFMIYAPVSEVGYGLAIVVPAQELLAGATEAQAQIAASTRNSLVLGGVLVAIILILAFLAAFFIGNRLVKPLAVLTSVAGEIAKGNLDVEARVGGQDEIGLLAATFNSMTTQLRSSIGALEQRVAARTQDLETVAEVSTATATILETDRLLQAVVDLTKERFKLYHSHIYLLDGTGENLVLVAGAGEPGRVMVAEKRTIPLDREQSLVARAARESKGVIVNDVTQAPDFLPNPLLPDTRSELAVPMIVGGKVIGVFDIQSDQVDRFTESDINVQTTLAAQIATSIQNVRSFEQTKAQADVEALAGDIGEKIQRTSSIQEALQTAIRELGVVLSASRVSANITTLRQNDEDRIESE